MKESENARSGTGLTAAQEFLRQLWEEHVRYEYPFVERLIGTLRREYLDRLFFWNGTDLERKLLAY